LRGASPIVANDRVEKLQSGGTSDDGTRPKNDVVSEIRLAEAGAPDWSFGPDTIRLAWDLLPPAARQRR
jgi:hypothetical protein